MSSLKRFLNYSYEPFRLHFCGPQDEPSQKIVDDYLKGRKISFARLKKIAEQFVGVYPYLKLIAAKNNLKPLDEKVIEAYWLGNDLLKQVTTDDLKKLIREDFVGPGKLSLAQAEKLVQHLPERSLAHHSFHVLYVGSVTQTVNLVGKLLDLCRVSWGKTQSLKRKTQSYGSLIVKYRPLIIRSNEIRLSKDETEKEIKWNQKILPKVLQGQLVSFHWDLAAEVLSEDQAHWLEKCTVRNIEAVNTNSPRITREYLRALGASLVNN